jgi:hypothetical protein
MVPSALIVPSGPMVPSGTMVPSVTMVPSGPMVSSGAMVSSGHMVPSGLLLPSVPVLPSGLFVPSETLLPSGSLYSDDLFIQSRPPTQNIYDQIPRLIPIQQHPQISDIDRSQLNSNYQTRSDKNQLQGVEMSINSFTNQHHSVIKDPRADNTNNSSKNNHNEEDIEEFVNIGSENQVNTKHILRDIIY